jgi:hypothetical protein
MGGTGGFIRRCVRLQGGVRERTGNGNCNRRSFDYATDDDAVRCFAQDDNLHEMASLKMTIYLERNGECDG